MEKFNFQNTDKEFLLMYYLLNKIGIVCLTNFSEKDLSILFEIEIGILKRYKKLYEDLLLTLDKFKPLNIITYRSEILLNFSYSDRTVRFNFSNTEIQMVGEIYNLIKRLNKIIDQMEIETEPNLHKRKK